MRWGSNLSCRNLQSAGSELFSLSLPKDVFPETKRIQKHKQVLEGASRAPSSPPKKQEPWGAGISQTRFFVIAIVMGIAIAIVTAFPLSSSLIY